MPEQQKTEERQGAEPANAEATAEPPVLRNRVARQYPLELEASPEKADHAAEESIHKFDLFKHPSCVATLVLLSALIAYGVTDSLPLGETYVGGYPYWLFGLAGVFAAGLAWAINGAGRVPKRVAIGLAFVAGVVGAAAAHPALLRMNAFTDPGDPHEVEYVRDQGNYFRPAEGDWPGIDMVGRAHWLNMPGDVRRTLYIRRGGLGFYQADLTGIRFELEIAESIGGSG